MHRDAEHHVPRKRPVVNGACKLEATGTGPAPAHVHGMLRLPAHERLAARATHGVSTWQRHGVAEHALAHTAHEAVKNGIFHSGRLAHLLVGAVRLQPLAFALALSCEAGALLALLLSTTVTCVIVGLVVVTLLLLLLLLLCIM